MDATEFNNLLSFINSNLTIYPPSHADTSTKAALNKRAFYKRSAQKFFVKDNVLYRYIPGNIHGAEVVIKGRERSVIWEFHDGAFGGHSGVNKTIAAIKIRYWWLGLTDDVKAYIRSCEKCQKSDPLKPAPKPELQPIKVSQPFEMIGVDLVGPLAETTSGNRYIFTATDFFSKWVEAFPIPSKTAEDVSRCMMKLFCRFGAVKAVLTDQGREFVNEVNRQLCKSWKVTHKMTAAYHPQTNGLDERTNQTIKTALRKVVNQNQSDWDEHLDGVLFSLRTKPQSSTKFSPFFLLYGREALYPSQLTETFDLTEIPTIEDQEETMTRRQEQIDITETEVKSNIAAAQEKQKEDYAKRKRGSRYVELKEGDKVLLHNTKKYTKKSKGNLETNYTGPYVICSVQKKTAQLKDLKGAVLKTRVNIDRLKAFKDGPAVSVEATFADSTPTVDSSTVEVEEKQSEGTASTPSTDGHAKVVEGKQTKTVASSTARSALKVQENQTVPPVSTPSADEQSASVVEPGQASSAGSSLSDVRFSLEVEGTRVSLPESTPSVERPDLDDGMKQRMKPGLTPTVDKLVSEVEGRQTVLPDSAGSKLKRSQARSQRSKASSILKSSQASSAEGRKDQAAVEVRPAPTTPQQTSWEKAENSLLMLKDRASSTTDQETRFLLQSVCSGVFPDVLAKVQQLSFPALHDPQQCQDLIDTDPVTSFVSEVSSRFETKMDKFVRVISPHMQQASSSVERQTSETILLAALYTVSMTSLQPVSSLVQTLKILPDLVGEMTDDGRLDRSTRISIHGETLDADDIETLDNDNWLNDKVMNSYLTLLKVEKNMGATHIFVLPSYTAVHWERGLFHPWLFKKVQFSNFEKILMPVNVNGNHWVLFVADMVYKTVGVLDSLGGSHEFKYITYWRKFLETRKQHVTETIPGPWTLEPYPTNLQTDGNSCGVFTLMNAECLVKNEPVNIMRQVHVPAFRRHVRSSILAKGQRKTDRYCDWPECSSRRGHQRWIQCSVCGRWFHTRCVAIPIKAAIEEDFECVFCCAIYH